jgi:hypothetical protein
MFKFKLKLKYESPLYLPKVGMYFEIGRDQYKITKVTEDFVWLHWYDRFSGRICGYEHYDDGININHYREYVVEGVYKYISQDKVIDAELIKFKL